MSLRSNFGGAILLGAALLASPAAAQTSYPIQYGFLWHMHQPNYYPYESIVQTDANGRYSFSVVEVHNSRQGPYTTWPKDAVAAGTGMAHLGAQVSFTGSLIENLNVLRDNGYSQWNNWQAGYMEGIGLKTTLNNPRLDMVAFGYHHPLGPLVDYRDMRMQVKLHKYLYTQTWPGQPYSKGMFPAENAFANRMIPALVAEGLDWVMVDNIHFDRACKGYPHTNASNLFSPNKADQVNPDPSQNGGAWVQLQNVWAPSKVSAPFGYQPAYVQHVDPETGTATKMVAVPTARYEGNEDGRGGYGAFLYGSVMDLYRQYNTNASRPMFVILHHDGDNYGGGTEAYYHSNFQNMISWDNGDPNYECSTVNDYLQRFPVPQDALIHVEQGSWAGADNGDPEFKKWLGDPNVSGWSPDRNSWAVMTAASNIVHTADDIAPASSMAGVFAGNGTNTEKAWHFLLCGQASDHWYWDGTEVWDSNVTRACNQAVQFANQVVAGQQDQTPPNVFVPQREPYNPGGLEWTATPMPSDFEVWTYVYDMSGLGSVTLKWRTDNDGENPLTSVQNETFAGGSEVGAWQSVAMSTRANPTKPAGILTPTVIATQYYGQITGQNNVLIDYYVEATDLQGNTHKSDIQHVWVGQSSGGGTGGTTVTTEPSPLIQTQQATIRYENEGGPLAAAAAITIHYGYGNWAAGTVTDAAMTYSAASGKWEISLTMPADRTQFDCVFNNGSGTWDNNSGADWHLPIQPVGTATLTPTVTPTPSATPTPSLTPSISPTASLTPTVSPSPTVSLTPSISPTPSLSPTASPVPTATPVGVRAFSVPSPLVQGQQGMIIYENDGGLLNGAAAITIHYGTNGWQGISDAAMTFNATSGMWEYSFTPTATQTMFDCVFNNGAGVWDNNSSADWHFQIVAGPTPTPSPSPSPSVSPTASLSPSPSLTESPTPSPSPSETVSPSPTESLTPSPSATAGPTASPTATASLSPSETASPTASSTPTASATATATPSLTASPSVSPSPTVSQSPSPTPIVVTRAMILDVLLGTAAVPEADVLESGDADQNGFWDSGDLVAAP